MLVAIFFVLPIFSCSCFSYFVTIGDYTQRLKAKVTGISCISYNYVYLSVFA